MITKEGYPIIAVLTLATLVAGVVGSSLNSDILIIFMIITGLLLLFCLIFFRDPKRIIPQRDGLFVSPADGKIIQIETIEDLEIGRAHLISIFLNVFNVHINRTPASGLVEKVRYKKGKFLAAFKHDASEENEQTLICINTNSGLIKIKQIAGLIARRIHCYVKRESRLEIGDKIGFIMFGSRVDIIMSVNIDLAIELGQKVKGGETIIGKLSEKQK